MQSFRTWQAMKFLIILPLIAGLTPPAAGQCELDKFLASDGAEFDRFGLSIDTGGTIGNEITIIGARGNDDNGSSSGSAYLFSTITGRQLFKLLPNDGESNDQFGTSVAISGTTAIVGVYLDDDNGGFSGSAYLFDTTTGLQIAKLLPNDGAAFDYFGLSAAISSSPGNEVAVIGAPLDDDNGLQSGSAYIFDITTGQQVAKLIPSDGEAGDRFGDSVAIGNSVAIVGASKDDDNDIDSGSAYVFRFNGTTWIEEAKLLASDGTFDDRFGWPISINSIPGNEVVIIGAIRVDANGSNSGSAYVFRNNGSNWIEEAKLRPSDGEADDWFGSSVTISGVAENEVVIVGATGDDDNGSNSGSVYMFQYDGESWLEKVKLLASDGEANDQFGISVSISGTPENEIIVVGARYDDDKGTDSGSAYVFTNLTSPPCPADMNCDAAVGVIDLLALLGGWGPNPGHPADFNRDGTVNVADLLAMLAAWGACP